MKTSHDDMLKPVASLHSIYHKSMWLGAPFWDRIAPIPYPEASVSTWNFLLESGNANTGVEPNLVFEVSNAIWPSVSIEKPLYLANQ